MNNINGVMVSNVILESGRQLSISATGTSMYPTIQNGDRIVVRPAKANNISIGDVILYTGNGEMIAHRLIRKLKKNGRMILVTKGDALPWFDNPPAPENVIGKVITIERKGRKVKLDSKLGRLISIFWVMTTPFFPQIYLIYQAIKRHFKGFSSNGFLKNLI